MSAPWLFPESESERSQREHNEGQKDGADADLMDIAGHAIFYPICSDAYNKGFEHGLFNKPNDDPGSSSENTGDGGNDSSGGGSWGSSAGSSTNSGVSSGGGSGDTSTGAAVGGFVVLAVLGLCVYGVVCFFRGSGGNTAPQAPPAKMQNAMSPAQARPEPIARQQAQRDAEDRNRAKKEAELVARQKAKERAELLARQQAKQEAEARARQEAKEQAERSARTVEYRCPQTYTKKTDAPTARKMGEDLNRLEIPWKGDDIYYRWRYGSPQYQYTVMRYGARSDWQRREFLNESEARTWLVAMQLQGFEAHLLSD